MNKYAFELAQRIVANHLAQVKEAAVRQVGGYFKKLLDAKRLGKPLAEMAPEMGKLAPAGTLTNMGEVGGVLKPRHLQRWAQAAPQAAMARASMETGLQNQAVRNALIGAGVGGIGGMVSADEGHGFGGALQGALMGGAAGYGGTKLWQNMRPEVAQSRLAGQRANALTQAMGVQNVNRSQQAQNVVNRNMGAKQNIINRLSTQG